MGELQTQHRTFLQALLWKKICDYDEVVLLHQKCHDNAKVPLGDLKIFIGIINCALAPLNMGIKKGVDELTGKNYYVLYNNANNPISKLNDLYKKHETELFQIILLAIVESDDGKLLSTVALNFADKVKISKKEADDTIKKFKIDKWLCEKDGYIFLSTRAIVELQYFFKEHFSDTIETCSLCKSFVFQGKTCKTCEIKIHFHCKSHYFSKGAKTCPSCSNSFE